MANVATPVSTEPKARRGRKPQAAPTPEPLVTPDGSFDFSRANQTINDPDLFIRFVRAYPDRTGIMAYIYRLSPKIDHSLIGLAERSLLKTISPDEMTPEYIAGRWGRGEYQIRLNDVNRPNNARSVANTKIRITDPDLVPIYDPRCLLVSEPENSQEVARLLASGVMVRDTATGLPRVRLAGDGAPVPAPNGGFFPYGQIPSAAAAAPVAPGDMSTNFMQAAILKMLDRSLTPPANVLEDSFRIADRLVPPAAPAPSLDEIASAVAEKIKPGGGVGGMDTDLAVYERVEAFLAKIGVGSKNAAAAPANWATAVAAVPGILSGFAQVVPEILRGLAYVRAAGSAPAIRVPSDAPQSGQASSAGFSGPQGPEIALRAVSAPVSPVSESSSPAPAAGPVAVPPAPAASDDDLLFGRIVQVGQLALEKFKLGVTGFDFAAWLISWQSWGTDVFSLLYEKGTEGCLGFLAMAGPEGAALLADEQKRAKLSAWLDDFFTYDPGSESEGDEQAAPEEALP